MLVKDAVVARFEQICSDRNIKANHLANLAGVTPSTVYSMLDPSRKDVSISTIKILCDGLGISIAEFFNNPLFENLEQEIR